MAVSTEAAVAAIFGTLKKNWGWLLALGVVMIVLGTIGLYLTFALTLATVLFFGALILAGGTLQLIHAFSSKGWKSVLGHVLIALLYIGAGALIMIDPVLASGVLTLALAGILIAVGVIRISMGIQLRRAVAGRYDCPAMARLGALGDRPVRGHRTHPEWLVLCLCRAGRTQGSRNRTYGRVIPMGGSVIHGC
jgi:uncharacterized membrane protein HdeD (DUF308 family)